MRIFSWPSFLAALILLSACKGDAKSENQLSPMDYARQNVVEATIAGTQNDIRLGNTTCMAVINAYIERIETYNPLLGAITYKNYDEARRKAQAVDRAIAENTPLPLLYCTPILVKDNIDVEGFPTTAGSRAMLENMPPDDAQLIKNLKANGAIILAKTNMAEWAFSPKRTKSTSAGVTKNAYNTAYVPAGSSGGTASGIAASLAMAGLGTDTGNSVRGPSSHLSLVGMRSTHGLLDLDGIVPLVLSADVVGPMTRTVSDNVVMFHAMGGADYRAELDRKALQGKRIGIVRALANPDDMHPEINALFEAALSDLRRNGAIIVDPAEINDIEASIEASWGCKSFRKDVHEYLTAPGMNAPISDPYEAYDAGIFAPYTQGAWDFFRDGTLTKAVHSDGTECGDLEKDALRQKIKADIQGAMEAQNLDALIYPSWRYPPARLDRAEEDYKGDNSQSLAPPTGLPAITVPMGFTDNDLPAGLQFLGRENAEGLLYALAYSYEQNTTLRHAPAGFEAVK